MQKIEQQIHGHHVVVQPDQADPTATDRVQIHVGERRFFAQLDADLGWSCADHPFYGHASPLALARALAASHAVEAGG